MKKIDQLRMQRDKVCEELEKLNAVLRNFERPINRLLLESKRDLTDLAVVERLQVANLLLEMYEDVQESEDEQDANVINRDQGRTATGTNLSYGLARRKKIEPD